MLTDSPRLWHYVTSTASSVLPCGAESLALFSGRALAGTAFSHVALLAEAQFIILQRSSPRPLLPTLPTQKTSLQPWQPQHLASIS